jgi:glucan phosphoethanolaminetransferase (alkaline phosphatase superfamily)
MNNNNNNITISTPSTSLLSKCGNAFDGLGYVVITERSFIYLGVYLILIGCPIITIASNITLKLLIATLILLSFSLNIIITSNKIILKNLNNFNIHPVNDVVSGSLLWWHIVVLILIAIIAILTRQDYLIWSGDFPDLSISDYIKQTFQHY